MDKTEVANNLLERLKKPTAEANAVTGDNHVRIVKAEMFKLRTYELAAVIDKNPDHPVAKAYARAIKQNAPNDEIVVEKVDLEAMLQNKEVLETSEVSETDIEGLVIPARYQGKKLGGDYKKPEASVPGKSPDTITRPNSGLNESLESTLPAEGEEKRDTFSTVGRRR